MTREDIIRMKSCTWTQVDTEHTPDTWESNCGVMWTFTDGGPKENGMHYCHKCGKPLEEKQCSNG